MNSRPIVVERAEPAVDDVGVPRAVQPWWHSSAGPASRPCWVAGVSTAWRTLFVVGGIVVALVWPRRICHTGQQARRDRASPGRAASGCSSAWLCFIGFLAEGAVLDWSAVFLNFSPRHGAVVMRGWVTPHSRGPSHRPTWWGDAFVRRVGAAT